MHFGVWGLNSSVQALPQETKSRKLQWKKLLWKRKKCRSERLGVEQPKRLWEVSNDWKL
jgi:hypothetical protein